MVKRASILGIDIGGVIIDAANDQHDTSMFGKKYLEATAVPGAFEAIALLAERFNGQVILVSKAGAQMQARTREWLAYHGFWVKTALAKEGGGNLIFCRERRDKAPICKRLNITHFIDDRLDVLVHLTSVKKRFLFGNGQGKPAAAAHKTGIYKIADWADALERVRP